MNAKQMFEELTELTKQLGISIRRERGNFKSGYCVLNEEKIIILNKTSTQEVLTAALARSLNHFDLNDIYIKPAVRDYLENEFVNIDNIVEFNIDDEQE